MLLPEVPKMSVVKGTMVLVAHGIDGERWVPLQMSEHLHPSNPALLNIGKE